MPLQGKRKWTVSNMKCAIEAVRNEKMATRTAAKKFNIPTSTLSRYAKSNKSIDEIVNGNQPKSKALEMVKEKNSSEETDSSSSSEDDEPIPEPLPVPVQCIAPYKSTFDIFGDFVIAQLKELPVDKAYITMAEIQSLLTNIKLNELMHANPPIG